MIRGTVLASLFVLPFALLAAALWLNIAGPALDQRYDYVVKLELPPLDRPVDLPPVSGPQDASRPLVVIDAGHGGFDPGAGGGEVKEKAVALAIARALRGKLLESGGIRVAMTRDEDRFIALPDRPAIARRLGADLFVSIHADSIDSDGASGASVYVLSERGSSEAAARFAARENQAAQVNGISLPDTSDGVGAILLDLSQREAQAGSSEAAQLLLREVRGKVPLHRDTVESAALAVLKAPDVPSVLFETGYISNPQDAQYLNSPEGRDTIAEAAARAIRAFLARSSAAGA